MKTILIILALLIPSLSYAAPLTEQQSTSLISVVQSSPGTPASAFVDLITAFSSITVPQATSLISVIQSAPGAPASSLVSLLTAFTVDTVQPDPVVSVTGQPQPQAATVQNEPVVPVKCSPSNPTDENMKLTDVAPPQINIRNLIDYWEGDTIRGVVSAVAPGMVMDEQNCSRMTLSRRSGSPAYIEYFIDGVSIGYPKGAPNFSSDSMVLDTTKYVDGPHTLSITAGDAGGNISSESLDFFIKNEGV